MQFSWSVCITYLEFLSCSLMARCKLVGSPCDERFDCSFPPSSEKGCPEFLPRVAFHGEFNSFSVCCGVSAEGFQDAGRWRNADVCFVSTRLFTVCTWQSALIIFHIFL
ncbi:hypothetical protein AVEN_221855-1 [Araneus ventricosus]|uniref:Secreted protein n=1 Tax=Araneus ventricosus TaxID=182803 RepID=A0A4Y2FW49_ARAVE|nr:hypothetical protein AVEN_221855-1 [Araneus ventricosus]